MKKYANKKCHKKRVAYRTPSSFRYQQIQRLVPHLSKKGVGLAKKTIKRYDKKNAR